MELTRVYPNGQSVTFLSETHEFLSQYKSVQHWIDYNQTYRFGCSLFIDGACIYSGYQSLAGKGQPAVVT